MEDSCSQDGSHDTLHQSHFTSCHCPVLVNRRLAFNTVCYGERSRIKHDIVPEDLRVLYVRQMAHRCTECIMKVIVACSGNHELLRGFRLPPATTDAFTHSLENTCPGRAKLGRSVWCSEPCTNGSGAVNQTVNFLL